MKRFMALKLWAASAIIIMIMLPNAREPRVIQVAVKVYF